ncbi:MAG TPA: aspartate carbamoyltransferase regulatory subunit [Oscillospiraceae bacterium]|nr:aspartate carbamoyltransferase regulatory subunit [Oscillospiraceae bacterium]
MKIDSIANGIVLDHIQAGKSMELYRYLNLDALDCSVAIIKNARSNKMGRKDVLKIDSLIDLDLDMLGYLDPNITVSIIRNGTVERKLHLAPPQRLVNIKKCNNPRCITSVERGLDQVFIMRDGVYRCLYCDGEK